MNKEFIPYEQALELKELDFDEPCIFLYLNNDKKTMTNSMKGADTNSWLKEHCSGHKNSITAPLYQQAFRFFREKYDLDSYIFCTYVGILYEHSTYTFSIQELYRPNYFIDQDRYTYQEAEFECLKKLIEIVKTK